MKIKKLLCTLLAIAIIFSIPLTSFAEVMNIKKFYDEDENILYYFGNFDPETDTDAGLEIAGKDYRIDDVSGSYGKFNISKLMDGNFGIGFENPENLGKVEIKPYAKNADGEKVYYGRSFSYDPDAVSDKTVLASAQTEFGIMSPPFSPEITEYYVGISSADVLPKITYTAAEGCSAVVEEAAEINGTTKITVTDKDNKSREYTFTYNLITPISSEIGVQAVDNYVIECDTRTKKVHYTTNHAPTGMSDRITFWKVDKTNNESNGIYDMGIYTYEFGENVTIDNFGDFRLEFTYAATDTCFQNQSKYKFSTFEVFNNDLTKSTVNESAVAESKIEIGDVISSVEVNTSDVAVGNKLIIDVTDFARHQLLEGKRKFSVGLAVTGLGTLNDTFGEYIKFWSYNTTSSNRTTKIYCKSLDSTAYLENIAVSDDEAILVKKNDTTYYVGVPAESAALPAITYTTPSGVTASVKNSASAVGENTVITASSEGGLVKTDYTFIYESYTPTTGTFKTASESTGIQSTDNAIKNYDTYDRIYSYTTGKQIFSVMKFDLTDKNPSKYDKFVIGLRTQGKANKATDGNDITADVTFEFNAVNCVDSNWTRANAVGTNFERTSVIGTQCVSVKAGEMDNAYIYCDVSDYVRELLANDIKVFTISACISAVSDYCNNSSIDIRAFRADYAGNYTLDTYGPWILINKETK